MCAFPHIAHATYFDLFGVGGRSSALGSAVTASANDFSAAYYNPALLTLATEPSLALGYSLSQPDLKIEMANPNGPYPSQVPTLTHGLTVGLAMPLPGRLGERVAVGAALFVPVGPFVRIRMLDNATPYFYLYDYTANAFTISASLGVRIFDWLRVGAGFHTLASFAGPANIQLDIANGSFTKRTLDADLVLNIAPIIGIAITPLPGLSIAAAFRGAQSLDVNLPAKVQFQGLDASLNLVIAGTTQYSPNTLSFGIAYKLPPIPLLLMMDVSYALWSLAPDPSLQVVLDLAGADIDRLGLGTVIDAPKKGFERVIPNDYFSNTLGVRAGAELDPLSWLSLRAGYNFRPTPVPLQTSGTNMLDNDTHTLSLGVGFNFFDPSKFFGGRFSIDITGQLGLLAQRTHVKDTANDPVGDLASGGTIYGASAMVRYLFGE